MIKILLTTVFLEIKGSVTSYEPFFDEKLLDEMRYDYMTSNNLYLEQYIDSVENLLFTKIKEMIFDVAYHKFRKAAIEFANNSKEVSVTKIYAIEDIIKTRNFEIDNFISEVMKILNKWNKENSTSLKSVFNSKMMINYYIIIQKIKDENSINNKILTILNTDLLESVLKQSVKAVSFQLLSDLTLSFKNIYKKIDVAEQKMIYLNNKKRLEFVKNMAVEFKEIFNNLFFTLNKTFYIQNQDLINNASKNLFGENNTIIESLN